MAKNTGRGSRYARGERPMPLERGYTQRRRLNPLVLRIRAMLASLMRRM